MHRVHEKIYNRDITEWVEKNAQELNEMYEILTLPSNKKLKVASFSDFCYFMYKYWKIDY